jgi:hypothetical protein
MSYDRQIDQICPHIVAEEGLFVSPIDRQTVVPLQPISNLGSIVLNYNGAFNVPPNGVQVAAQVTGSAVGPYNIVTGANDTMVVTVDQGTPQTLVVPATNQITPNHLVALLNPQVAGMAFTSNGNQIGIKSASTGVGASIYISAASTLAPTLGLTTNRFYRGVQAAPGWTLVSDPQSLTNPPLRLIVFDEPLKGFNDFVQLSYSTTQQTCRRCGGLGVENDWRYGSTGETANVIDEALLIQESQKLMFTLLGSNPFHIWYGTQIENSVGQKIASGGFNQNSILQDAYTAFQRWQSIKRQQEQVVGQILTDEEYPLRLVSVTLNQSTSDPTICFLTLVIQNRSTKPIQLTRGLVLPQPLDLLGSTQQQGLIRQSLSGYVLTG